MPWMIVCPQCGARNPFRYQTANEAVYKVDPPAPYVKAPSPDPKESCTFTITRLTHTHLWVCDECNAAWDTLPPTAIVPWRPKPDGTDPPTA